MNINDNNFSNIIYTAVVAFFGALCKEINDKSHDTRESFSIFFGEIILHGFSGWIIGLSANKFLGLNDLTSITIFAGIGGLFGYEMVKVIVKMILTTIANSRNIRLDDSDLDFDHHEKNNSDRSHKKK